MSNKFRKILAVICGVLLTIGIGFSIYLKDDEMITITVIYALVYIVYLVVLFKKLKKDETENKQSPLRRK